MATAAASVLFTVGSSGSASHMFIHIDSSAEDHFEVKTEMDITKEHSEDEDFTEDETAFAVTHHKAVKHQSMHKKKELKRCICRTEAACFISLRSLRELHNGKC